MIEGLILLTELGAVVMLLWTIQRRDTPGGRPPTSLFAYRDPDHPAKGDAPQGRDRSQRDA
jgi:hypothetical protein